MDGTGAYVGVCDTGVDYTHPDFGGDGTNHGFPTAKIVAGYDFAGDNAGAIDNPALIAPDPDPMDTNEHGTHVSGIIAADGAVTGVAPKAKIVIAKISPAGIGSAWSERDHGRMGVHGGPEQRGRWEPRARIRPFSRST